MSHTTKITATKITSVSALRAAVDELVKKGIQCSLIEDAEPRHFYTFFGRPQEGMGRADYVLKLDAAAYDIGFYKQEDGSLEPRTDFWGETVEKLLGVPASEPKYEEQSKLGKLFAAYGIAATMEQARNSGKQVQRVEKADGTVQLVLSGY